jgi:hypothetical protein
MTSTAERALSLSGAIDGTTTIFDDFFLVTRTLGRPLVKSRAIRYQGRFF